MRVEEEWEAVHDAHDIALFVESEYYKPKVFAQLETEFNEKYGKSWKEYLSNLEEY